MQVQDLTDQPIISGVVFYPNFIDLEDAMDRLDRFLPKASRIWNKLTHQS